VSLYPYATSRGVGIRNWTYNFDEEIEQMRNRGLRLVRYKVPWENACGYNCPQLGRRLWQLEHLVF
jgi:hypothetical protein